MDSTGEATARPEIRTSRTGRILKAPRAYVPAPTSSATGGRPRKEAVVVCLGCGRGHSPKTNQIVFCDGCNGTWHQRCHDPLIEDHVVEEESAEWQCHVCKPVGRPTPARPETAKKARRVHPRTAKGGPGLEVSGAELSVDKRRRYLSRLSHAELVELAVKVSVQNPQVHMFPRDMSVLGLSQFVPPQSGTLAANEESRGDESGSSKGPTKRARGSSAPAKGTRKRAAPAEVEEPQPPKRFRPLSAPAAVKTEHIRLLEEEVELRLSEIRRLTRRYSTQFDVPFSGSPERRASCSPSLSPPGPAGETEAEPQIKREPSSEQDEDMMDLDSRLEHRFYPTVGNGFSATANSGDPDLLMEDPDYPTFSHNLIRKPSERLPANPAPGQKRSVSFSKVPQESAHSKPPSSKAAPKKPAQKAASTKASKRMPAPPKPTTPAPTTPTPTTTEQADLTEKPGAAVGGRQMTTRSQARSQRPPRK